MTTAPVSRSEFSPTVTSTIIVASSEHLNQTINKFSAGKIWEGTDTKTDTEKSEKTSSNQ